MHNQKHECEHKPHTTKYFGLPMWKANDVTSWLYGMNKAMIEIDKLFHDFALRTGIDGVPEELVTNVTNIENSIAILENQMRKNIGDIAETTKIVANTLANIEVIENKIKNLNFNYSNIDLRLASTENTSASVQAEVNKLAENMSILESNYADLEARVKALEDA